MADDLTNKVNEISKKIEEAPDSSLCRSILYYLDEHQERDYNPLDQMEKDLQCSYENMHENLNYLRTVHVLDKHFFMTHDAEIYVKGEN